MYFTLHTGVHMYIVCISTYVAAGCIAITPTYLLGFVSWHNHTVPATAASEAT